MFLQCSLDFFACIITEHNKQSTAHWLPLSSTAILPDSYHFLNKASLLLLLNFDPRSSLSLGVLIPLALPGLSLLVFEGPPKFFFFLRNNSYNIHHFNVWNSVVFSTSTMLCNHHHDQNTLVTQTKALYPLAVTFYSPFLPAADNHYCLSVWISLFREFHINGII